MFIKSKTTLTALCGFLLTASAAFASPVAYPFRVVDNSGALVPGATVAVGSTTLTPGSATSVPTSAGELVLSTGAAPASAPSVTLVAYGTGDYALVYDTSTQGELYLPLTVSKSGSTITGSTALVALVASNDPGNTSTAATQATAAASQTTPTNEQANNAASLTAYGAATAAAQATNVSTLSANQSAILARLGTPSGASIDADILTRSTYAGGAVTSVTGSVGSVTGNVGGSVGSVTAPVVASSVTSPVVASSVTAPVVASSVTGSVGSISGITFPSNFGTFSVDSSGRVTLVPGQSTVASNFVAAPAVAVDGSGRVVLQPSQPGVTIPTVTSLTNPVVASSVTGNVSGSVGSVIAPVSLPATAPSGYGGGGSAPTVQQIAAAILTNPSQPILTNSSGYVTTSNPATGGSAVTEATIWAYPARTLTAQADTPGTTTLLSRLPVTPPTAAQIAAAVPSLAQITALFPTEYLSSGEQAKLTSASTAQQAGVAVTLPSGGVLQSADLAAVTQAIMTYALHTGVSFQRAVAQIYLDTAAPVAPTKSGTVQTAPFKWPDATTGMTSTLDTTTNTRTETPGTLPN